MKQRILVSVLATLLSGAVFADEDTRILQSANVDYSEITIKQTGGDNKLVAQQQGNTYASTITATIEGSDNDSNSAYTEHNLLVQINADSSDMTANVGGSNNSFIVGQYNTGLSTIDMDISGDYNGVIAQQQTTEFSQLNMDVSGNQNALAALQVGDFKSEANNLTANIGIHGTNGVVNLCQGNADRCDTFAANNFNTGAATTGRYARAFESALANGGVPEAPSGDAIPDEDSNFPFSFNAPTL